MKTFSSIFLIFLSLCFFGCPGSTPTESSGNDDELFPSEKNPFLLYGTVVDSNNVPIANAEIHYIIKFPTFGKIQKTTPSTTIPFSIPATGHVSLKVFRFGTRELVATLVDTFLQSGNYNIIFNPKNLTNGMYVYQLRTDSIFVQKKMALMNLNLSELQQTVPLAKTNSVGKFQIPFSVLGIGEELDGSVSNNINSFIIDTISVVIFNKEKSFVLVEGFSVNPNQNLTRTFIMK